MGYGHSNSFLDKILVNLSLHPCMAVVAVTTVGLSGIVEDSFLLCFRGTTHHIVQGSIGLRIRMRGGLNYYYGNIIAKDGRRFRLHRPDQLWQDIVGGIQLNIGWSLETGDCCTISSFEIDQIIDADGIVKMAAEFMAAEAEETTAVGSEESATVSKVAEEVPGQTEVAAPAHRSNPVLTSTYHRSNPSLTATYQ